MKVKKIFLSLMVVPIISLASLSVVSCNSNNTNENPAKIEPIAKAPNKPNPTKINPTKINPTIGAKPTFINPTTTAVPKPTTTTTTTTTTTIEPTTTVSPKPTKTDTVIEPVTKPVVIKPTITPVTTTRPTIPVVTEPATKPHVIKDTTTAKPKPTTTSTTVIAKPTITTPTKPTTPTFDTKPVVNTFVASIQQDSTNLNIFKNKLKSKILNASNFEEQKNILNSLRYSLSEDELNSLKSSFSLYSHNQRTSRSWNAFVDEYIFTAATSNFVEGQTIPTITLKIIPSQDFASQLSEEEKAKLTVNLTDLGSFKRNINIINKLTINPKIINNYQVKQNRLVDFFGNDVSKKILFLNEFFTGIETSNINNIETKILPLGASKWTIELKAKNNFVFGNNNSNILNSNAFTISIATEENFINAQTTGQEMDESSLISFLRSKRSFSLNEDSFAILEHDRGSDKDADFYTKIENFPLLNDKNQAITFFRQSKNGNNAHFFTMRIHPRSLLGEKFGMRLQYPTIKDTDGRDLLISISGYINKEVVIDILKKMYKTELDNIIDDINTNGVTVNELGKATTINLANADSFNFNRFIDFGKKISSLSSSPICFDFKNIKINTKTGFVSTNISAYLKDKNTKSPYDIISSKESNLVSFKLKAIPNYEDSYNNMPSNLRTKIDTNKLETLVNIETKNNKSSYFAHKISRDLITQSILNYENRPSNVFLDFDMNANDGTLVVRLIERNFGNWDEKIDAFQPKPPENIIETYKKHVLSKYNSQIIDKVLEEHTIKGFKTWDSVPVSERGGFTTFKSWYAWRRTFVFNVARIQTKDRYSYSEEEKKYLPDDSGVFVRNDEVQKGTAWIANKISDSEFILATNGHVAEELHIANSLSEKKWNHNDYDFDYKDNIVLRQMPRNLDYENYEESVMGFEYDFTNDRIKREAPHKGFAQAVGKRWNVGHWETNTGLMNNWDDVESIKVAKNFGKKFTDKNDPKTLVTDFQPAYSASSFDGENNHEFGVSIDLTLFRVKFKTPNNNFNKIWDEIGPTSFAPVDDLTISNICNQQQFQNQSQQKNWNNLSFAGYPVYDFGENPSDADLNYGGALAPGKKKQYFVYKGDGGEDQNGQNDYLDSIVNLELGKRGDGELGDFSINTFDLRLFQKDNEGSAGGSSGSPVFDKNMNIIAILWGGDNHILDEAKLRTSITTPLWTEMRTSAFTISQGNSFFYLGGDNLLYKQKFINYNIIPKLK